MTDVETAQDEHERPGLINRLKRKIRAALDPVLDRLPALPRYLIAGYSFPLLWVGMTLGFFLVAYLLAGEGSEVTTMKMVMDVAFVYLWSGAIFCLLLAPAMVSDNVLRGHKSVKFRINTFTSIFMACLPLYLTFIAIEFNVAMAVTIDPATAITPEYALAEKQKMNDFVFSFWNILALIAWVWGLCFAARGEAVEVLKPGHLTPKDKKIINIFYVATFFGGWLVLINTALSWEEGHALINLLPVLEKMGAMYMAAGAENGYFSTTFGLGLALVFYAVLAAFFFFWPIMWMCESMVAPMFVFLAGNRKSTVIAVDTATVPPQTA